MRARILAAMGALLLSACGATAHLLGSAAPTPVPWIDAGPTPIPTPPPVPVPTGTTFCRGSDLGVALGRSNGLTNGQVVGSIAFTNRGPVVCFLKGAPRMWLLDAQGMVLPIVQSPDLRSGEDLVFLPPGGQAWVELSWRMHNGVGTCPNPPPLVRAIRVAVADQTVTLKVDPLFAPYGLTACGWAVGVTAYQRATVETPPPPVQLNLAMTLAVPTSVRAGDALNYTVTLRNVSGTGVVFGAYCPAYVQVVTNGADQVIGKAAYLLNCQPVGAIAPGAAVTFAMRLFLPQQATPGRYVLSWDLIGRLSKADLPRATFTVTS